jgi:hypothetical protein
LEPALSQKLAYIPSNNFTSVTSQLDAGAGEEARTLDLNLGKVALYQLSYSRMSNNDYRRNQRHFKPALDAYPKKLEREKRLELSTSTLARLRSTN